MFPDATDAEDATQDALLAVVRGLPGFDGRSAFSTWVHRVTTNACLDELRRRGRRPRSVRSIGPADADGSGPQPHEPVDEAPPVADRLADRMVLDDALAALPADFRAAVVLRDQLDLDYAEIGQILGIPPGTVRSRIARGRARLAETLATDAAAEGNPGAGDGVQRSGP